MQPGDLILTGTPEGVGPIEAGQTVLVRNYVGTSPSKTPSCTHTHNSSSVSIRMASPPSSFFQAGLNDDYTMTFGVENKQ